ncbi:MAG: hypothetical protein ACRBBQ_08280 [Cognatishimia sp.]
MVSLVLVITAILTSVMTYNKLPVGESFLQTWLPTWLFTAVIMAPFGVGMFMASGWVFDRLFSGLPYIMRAILQGLTIAAFMESIMAATTAYRLHGFVAGYGDVWVSNLLISLPFALAISAVMNIFIKGKLDAYLAS